MENPHSAMGRVDVGSRNKSEVITIRINPKVKFGPELMARLHNRTVAQTVEMAIECVLDDPFDGTQHLRDVNYAPRLIDELWSPHRGERLLRMVLGRPDLLCYEEELVWNKLERANVLDEYFESAKLPACELRADANRKDLEDRIDQFWDELDAAEREEAIRKKREKEKGKDKSPG